LNEKGSRVKKLIISVSIALPLAVAALYLMPKAGANASWIKAIPHFNAVLNSITALLLMAGYWAIRSGKKELHRRIMFSALVLSALFLVGYVIYHANVESVKYGGEGLIRSVYLFILLTHIVLAAVIVPLVLISFSRALAQKFDKHRKIARWTLPLWLYVAVTGVIVYFMISPYYS
jgi:putative membrane protein